MNIKRVLAFLLAAVMMLSLCACGKEDTAGSNSSEDTTAVTLGETTVTDMIGRELVVNPGSYQRVVCIGAGALRMYCYVGDTARLCGVEDIDNVNAEGRPAMFDGVARPYVLAYGDVFNTLPSCGVGGPMAQTADAEKILSCNPDIVISEYEDVQKADALQEQLGIPVVTLSWARFSTVRSRPTHWSPLWKHRLPKFKAALQTLPMRISPPLTSAVLATGAPPTI